MPADPKPDPTTDFPRGNIIMSWTRLTPENRFLIDRAETILSRHRKIRHFLRSYCCCCLERWGAWGCDDRVWAVDYLNRLSDVIVEDKPAPLRPRCGRRDRRFRAHINRGVARARQALHHRTRITTAA